MNMYIKGHVCYIIFFKIILKVFNIFYQNFKKKLSSNKILVSH